MRYIQALLLGIIALTLMGIGPFFAPVDTKAKARSSYMLNCFQDGQLIGVDIHAAHRELAERAQLLWD